MRDEILRVAARLDLAVWMVSNGSRPIRPPGQAKVRMITVEAGADVADDWIAERIARGDVAITADIPLAARCLEAGALALAPNGKIWTPDNIGGALAGRALAHHLRETGVSTGGPAPMTKADRSRFLGALDTLARAALRSPANDT